MNWFGRHHSHKSNSAHGRSTFGHSTPGRSKEGHSAQDHFTHRQSVREHRADYLAAGSYGKPLLITAAVLGAALVAGGAYRYLKPRRGRTVYKSRSRKPQISRWESEGGDVPQVQSLQPRRTH